MDCFYKYPNIKMRIGEYYGSIQEKGVNEAFIDDIKEGDLFFTVQLDKDSKFDTKNHVEAIIISKLIKIEKMLKKGVRSR